MKQYILDVDRRVLSLIFLTCFLQEFSEGKKTETKTGFGQNASPISTYCSHVPDLLTAKPFLEGFLFQGIRQKSWTS